MNNDSDPELLEWLELEIDWYINDSPNSVAFRNHIRLVNPLLADDDNKIKKYMLEMFKDGTMAILSNPVTGNYYFAVLRDDGFWKAI